MSLDELIRKLQEVQKEHGGDVLVNIRTSYYDNAEGWMDTQDSVNKVTFIANRGRCFIDADEFEIYK